MSNCNWRPEPEEYPDEESEKETAPQPEAEEPVITYMEAALILGLDHHWVRILTKAGVFRQVTRIEVRRNVLKVYIALKEVLEYQEEHRVRETRRVRMTAEQWEEFEAKFKPHKMKGS